MSTKYQLATIPNAISFYRLCAAPFAAYAAIDGNRSLFAVLIIISLLSDVADGLIARVFRQQSDFGARLDSVADDITFAVGVLGIFMFEFDAISADIFWLLLLMILWILSTVLPLIRFGRTPAFHLYSFRANGYLLALFFVYLFAVGYSQTFFILVTVFGSLACIEVIAVTLVLDEFKTNQRGLWWVLRERHRNRI